MVTLQAWSRRRTVSRQRRFASPSSIFSAGRHPAAYQGLDDVLKKFPTDERTLEAKARFLLVDGKNDEALKIATTVRDGKPEGGQKSLHPCGRASIQRVD